MVSYVFPPPPVAALPIKGSEALFPVRRIFCVGRNYAEHAIEMGSDPTREPPFYFTKPADAVVVNGADMPYPPASKSLHHEMELVVAIGRGGRTSRWRRALPCLGLLLRPRHDRRDLQNEARRPGAPGTGKGFDRSAPMGPLIPRRRLRPLRGRSS